MYVYIEECGDSTINGTARQSEVRRGLILRTSFQGFDLTAVCSYEHRLRSLCNK
jgi:hypothetical protein